MFRTTLALALLTTPAWAEDTTFIAPVYAQLVSFTLPDGFAVGFEDPAPGFYIIEAPPIGQTVENWTQLISMTGAKDGVRGDIVENATLYASNIAAAYQQHCPDSYSTQTLDTPAIPGVLDAIAVYFACGPNADAAQAEGVVMLVLSGRKDIYTLQWAERFDAPAGPVPYDSARWASRLAALGEDARLCNPVTGEGAPYPSCVGN
jgi:hypothetical protein